MRRHKHLKVWVYIQRNNALLHPFVGHDDVSQYILQFDKAVSEPHCLVESLSRFRLSVLHLMVCSFPTFLMLRSFLPNFEPDFVNVDSPSTDLHQAKRQLCSNSQRIFCLLSSLCRSDTRTLRILPWPWLIKRQEKLLENTGVSRQTYQHLSTIPNSQYFICPHRNKFPFLTPSHRQNLRCLQPLSLLPLIREEHLPHTPSAPPRDLRYLKATTILTGPLLALVSARHTLRRLDLLPTPLITMYRQPSLLTSTMASTSLLHVPNSNT
jgi:hypothetical protein